MPTLHAMYVFGGLGAAGAIAEMWKYNVDSSRWSKLQVRTKIQPSSSLGVVSSSSIADRGFPLSPAYGIFFHLSLAGWDFQ